MAPNKPRRSLDGMTTGRVPKRPVAPARPPKTQNTPPTPVEDEDNVDFTYVPVAAQPVEDEDNIAFEYVKSETSSNSASQKVAKPMNTTKSTKTTKPEKPAKTEAKPVAKSEVVASEPTAKPVQEDKSGMSLQPKKRAWGFKKVILVVVGLALAAGLMALAVVYNWYTQQLTPVSADTSKHVRVDIKQGTAPTAIASTLQEKGVIRNQTAFMWYTKLSGTQNKLKAGVYNLQPSLSTQSIVDKLVEGKQDTFKVTFLPGDTLASARKTLIGLGIYSEAEVDAALAKNYDYDLFATKLAGTDLEGYFYGETMEFTASDSVEQVLMGFFGLFDKFVKDNDLVAKFKQQGLTLYQGITLASIVQREVNVPDDQKAVARVFLNRLAKNMTLGSDVTYQYAADKLGVPRTPDLDSPYNTRKFAGLPPGPIATPGNGALLAVANPASNDYLFFLSGDDDKTYFGKTDAEHEKNIVNHCKEKCQIM